MANLNLKACFNPYFTSKVDLVHYGTTYEGEFQEPTYKELSRASIWGIVTSDDRALERLPESIRSAGAVSVRYQTADAPEGFTGGAHDRVEWRGQVYSIADNGNGSHYGAGFVKLLCNPWEASDGDC